MQHQSSHIAEPPAREPGLLDSGAEDRFGACCALWLARQLQRRADHPASCPGRASLRRVTRALADLVAT